MITKNGYFVIYGSLTINVISILFSIPWLYFFSLTFLLLLLVQASSFYIIKRRLKDLKIFREVEDELHRWEKAKVSLTIKSKKSLPYVLIIDELPSGFELIEGNIGFKGKLDPGETKISYIIEPKEIGKHVFRKLRIICFDSFHLFFTEHDIELENVVYCYPTKTSKNIADIIRSFLLYSEIGHKSSKKSGEGFEFYSAREYSYGDDLKRIAWYQVAKSPERKLFIIEKEQEEKRNFRIVIPLTETLFEGLEGERKIDWISDAILTFSMLMIRLNTNLDIILMNGEKIDEIRIKNQHDIKNLIKYFGEIEVKKYIFDKNKLIKEILDRYEVGSFILIITDRSISKIKENFFENLIKKFNIEILIVKTFNEKYYENKILDLIKRYDEIELRKAEEMLGRIEVQYHICEPKSIIKNMLWVYNKARTYEEEIKYDRYF